MGYKKTNYESLESPSQHFGDVSAPTTVCNLRHHKCDCLEVPRELKDRNQPIKIERIYDPEFKDSYYKVTNTKTGSVETFTLASDVLDILVGPFTHGEVDLIVIQGK